MIRLALAAVACFVTASSFAFAENEPKVLRHLVYSVTSSQVSKHEEKISGMTETGGTMASNTSRTSSSGDDNGKLTVDIVALTGEGGLVADVAYAGKNGSLPPVRIGILPDGALATPRGFLVTQEIYHLVPLLGRYVVAGHDTADGSTWKSADSTYKVTGGNPARTEITLDVTTVRRVTGPNGFEESGKTTALYSVKLSDPLKVEYNGTYRRSQPLAGYQTKNVSVTAQLLEDSFAPQ